MSHSFADDLNLEWRVEVNGHDLTGYELNAVVGLVSGQADERKSYFVVEFVARARRGHVLEVGAEVIVG